MRIAWTCIIALGGALLGLVVTGNYRTFYGSGFDIIGTIVFGIAVSVAIALPLCTWRRRMIILFTMAGIYCGSYTALSASGGYFVSRSGKLRYKRSMAVSDCIVWHPKWLYWEPFLNVSGQKTSHGTVIGYFYLPLLHCDRKWVHPTKNIVDAI